MTPLNNFRRNLTIIIIAVVVLMFGFIITSYFNSQKQLSVKISGGINDFNIKIYKADNSNKQVAESAGENLEKKLTKGTYNVVFSGEKYQSQAIKTKLDKKDSVINITPSYNKKILSEMLEKDRSVLIQEINTKVPQTTSGFVITDLRLYFFGEWASAKIHVAQTEEEERENYIDTYRVVLKKDKDTWKLVTDPPELIISIKKYPNIPRDLLIQLNKNPESGL